jgi:hypothetical protein
MGTLGAQPGIGYGFAPAALIELPGLFGILAEGGIAATTGAEAEGGDVVAKAAFMHGGLALCPLLAHPWRISTLGCAGWIVGGVIGHGEGFDVERSGTAIVTGPWIEGRISIRIVGPVGAVASLGLMAPITRAELSYRTSSGSETLHETFHVVGMADAGVCVRMP